jgi:hypothetical protein
MTDSDMISKISLFQEVLLLHINLLSKNLFCCRNRGVDVKMDIPYALWNETSAEIRELHKQVRISGEFVLWIL